jgi:stage II sporulation protein D
MKNHNAIKSAAFLILTLLFYLASPALPVGAVENPPGMVRIGLYWGNNTLPSANLLNYVGGGYRFGYFDSSGSFVELASTSEKAVTMLKDWTMYLSGGKYYDSVPSSSYETVGCYHIRLNTAYDTYAEAASAAQSYSGGFAAYHSGKFYACAGSYASYSEACAALSARGLDGTAMTASPYCVTVVATGTTKILFQFDGGKDCSLSVMPISEEGEKAQTWFKGYKYYGGFQYARLTGENLTVVNFIDIDDYIKGVLPYEMNPEWPLEALKAQAVAARTYTAASLNGKHQSYGFDLCSEPDCQTYRGTNGATELSDRAVDETAGIYMTYEGKYAQTYYHSSDGGATENCENVFNEAIPYLRGKLDPYERNVETKRDSWSYTYTARDITGILQLKGYKCGNIIAVTPVYTELGNIYSLTFLDDKGVSWTFSKYSAGSILYSQTYGKYTYSQRFTIKAENGDADVASVYVNSAANRIEDTSGLYAIGSGGDAVPIGGLGKYSVITASGNETISISGGGKAIYADSFVVSGSGWGHNVGMSQYGAKAMAEMGYTYNDILNFYFTGVQIG